MKRLQVLIILLIIIIPSGIVRCTKTNSKETNPVDRIDPDTITFAHSMKGWELYSWPNGDDWNYSILIGTNRLKSYEEVTANKIVVTGTDSLKMLLDKFPVNENILWIGEGWLKRCWQSGYGDLSLPGNNIVNEIRNYCLQKNIDLNISN